MSCKKSKNQDEQESVDLTSISDSESLDVNVVTVSKQVCTSLNKWAKTQESGFNQLQEGKYFVLNVTPKENPGFFIVSLRCVKCNVPIQLHQKDSSNCHSPYLLKICFSKAAQTHLQPQPSLYDFFTHCNTTSSSSSIAPTKVSEQSNAFHNKESSSYNLVNEVTEQQSTSQGF